MRYLRFAYFPMTACAIAIALSGCSSTSMNTVTGSGAAPAVVNVGVQVNGVAPNRWQYLQFNEAMDPATINNQTIVVKDSGGTAVPGNVAYDADFNVAGFQPNPALADSATYSLTVTTGAASAQGVHMTAPYSYNFTTRADTDKSPITVKSVTPAANATCVSTSTPITITFNEGAEVSTLTSTNIVITGPGGAVIAAKIGYDVTNGMVTLTPSAALPSGTITVTIKNVADAAGVAITAPYSWIFSTACNGGGGGGGGTATTQFETPIFSEKNLDTQMNGQVTVDTSGNTTIHLTGATANTSYAAQFCPAFYPLSPQTPLNCIDLGTVSTDASGNASPTVKFPQPGNWAGDFVLNDASGKTIYQTFIAPNMNNQTYMAILLPLTTTDNGQDTTSTPQDPLTSGTVTLSGGVLKFVVNGAAPNTAYFANESETTYIFSSGTYGLGTLTTDAMGNGSLTTTTDLNGGDLFGVVPQFTNHAGFIGGFTVPK